MSELTLHVTGPADITVDWGDGSPTERFTFSQLGETSYTHVYGAEGVFDVSVTGQSNGVSLASPLVTEVKLFGTLGCKHYKFEGCTNLIKVPTSLPNTVRSLADTFSLCENFNDPSVSNWNTSNITDFSNTFAGSNFNQTLNWNTANGLTFSGMLDSASNFNQSIDGFSFDSAVDLSFMLRDATSFNQPITMTAPLATTVQGFLSGALSFNSALSLSSMSSCTNWGQFLQSAETFNQPITQIDLTAATNLDEFLSQAANFAQDLTTLDVERYATAPFDFAAGTSLTPEQMPLWGQPPAVPTEPGLEEPTTFSMITDAQTGVDLMLRPVPFPNTAGYASPLDAYNKWCTGLGIDSTINLNDNLLNDDDHAKLFNIPFVPTLSGSSTQMFHTSESGFGIYKNTLPGVTVYGNSLIGASAIDQQGVGSYWWPTTNPPAIIVGAKLPTADYVSMDAKHNATADTAVFYCKYHGYDEPTYGEVEFAMLLRQGKVTIVVGGATYDVSDQLNQNTYVNIYTMNEGTSSKIATATHGGVAHMVPNDGSLLILSSIPTAELPGA